MPKTSINMDAFANGQVGSKLWLCEQLEKNVPDGAVDIWVLGGWYGVLPFLLFSRDRINIRSIRSFDFDSQCQPIAEKINDNFIWKQHRFFAETSDIKDVFNRSDLQAPDIVINTSVEHMESRDWWLSVPEGTRVALQACNMDHPEHVDLCQSVDQLIERYPLKTLEFSGELPFEYGTKWDFTRFMTIGVK